MAGMEAETSTVMDSSGSTFTDSSGSSASADSATSSLGQTSSGLEQIALGPIDNFHQGTGTHTTSKLTVEPASVPGTGKLQFATASERVTTMLFQLNEQVVPNWFGVAIPSTVVDFTKPNIFFHPIPAQDGYKDADYPTKTGKWPQLFYYMERLGYQVDAAITVHGAPANQIVIMPFLTSAATSTGIFPARWLGLVSDILTSVRSAVAGITGAVMVTEVVVSSFSVGYVYSNSFRHLATGLTPMLRQVWDFDGYPKSLSGALTSTSSVKAVKYDQGNEQGSFHVPLTRWAAYPNPPPNPDDPPSPNNSGDVHQLIRDFMYLHAATLR
jgi:hypothetical protein